MVPSIDHLIAAAHRSPEAPALERLLQSRPADDPVAAFYRLHDYAPLWIEHGALRPEARGALAMLRGAGRDGLDPAAFHPDAVAAAMAAAAGGDPTKLVQAETALSEAVAAYASRLHAPAPGARLAFVDPAIAMAPADPQAALEALARAPSLAAGLADLQRMNPTYERLRAALAAAPDGPDAARLRINLERARALPPALGARYILVNPAAQTLWLVDGGRVTDTMRVIVGKTSEPTPSMIGLIRFAELDPYWNVPPDLAQGIARKVLTQGTGYLASSHLQVLSDWTPQATVVAPDRVDWAAAASGRIKLRLRQLPGPDNMMGKLKFMLPNPLGVYLHDTPNKALFAGDQRTDSAGCVRLADAGALGARLFGRPLAANPAAGPEQRVDLRPPVPVYILYLTEQPDPAGGAVTRLPDIYDRDPALLASS